MLITRTYYVHSAKRRIRMDTPKKSPSAVVDRIQRIITERADGKQKVMAEMAGIDSAVLSRIRNGHEPVTWGLLIKIERVTGARLNWLAYGAEPVYYPDYIAPDRDERDYYEGAYLEAYLRRHNIEQTELGRRMNKSKNTVRGYFKTELFSSKVKSAILSALNAKDDEVFNGFTSVAVNRRAGLQAVHVDNDNMCQVLNIPIGARSGAGYIAYFSDEPMNRIMEREYVSISADRLATGVPPERHVVVEVDQDNMQPVLESGFKMLAYSMLGDTYPPLSKIVMVDFQDQLTIKRLVGIDYVAKTVTLRADKNGAEIRLPMSDIKTVYYVYDYYKAWL